MGNELYTKKKGLLAIASIFKKSSMRDYIANDASRSSFDFGQLNEFDKRTVIEANTVVSEHLKIIEKISGSQITTVQEFGNLSSEKQQAIFRAMDTFDEKMQGQFSKKILFSMHREDLQAYEDNKKNK